MSALPEWWEVKTQIRGPETVLGLEGTAPHPQLGPARSPKGLQRSQTLRSPHGLDAFIKIQVEVNRLETARNSHQLLVGPVMLAISRVTLAVSRVTLAIALAIDVIRPEVQ